MSRSWIPRTEVLERLGVKAQTLYAYVSRGRIAARPDPDDPRRSLYAAEDVERLLDRTPKQGKHGQGAGGGGAAARGEAVVESALTTVIDGRLFFRGQDAVKLAETATLEQGARILWEGEEDPFAELKPRIDVNFPGGPRARAFAALSRRAEEDAATSGRSPRSLRREAASVLNELVDAISGGGPRLYLHQRLSRVWKLSEKDSQTVRKALVLAMDSELNAPTLATRMAASTGAALSACCLAGLSALSGPLYAGQLAQVYAYVAESRRGADARSAARQRLALGLEIPGFGHPLFPDGDPRAKALIATAGLPEDLLDIVRVGEGLTGQAPNFDMALALISRHLDLPRDGALAIYVVGRLAGWLAHALEEVTQGSPIRARLRYVGAEPEFA
ncbi:MAG TPA: citrate synthase [Caulobacteraceae bacterium]|jgi:citrate synthase|nr:citrate synthase [Caulobacteraceae bacterium]